MLSPSGKKRLSTVVLPVIFLFCLMTAANSPAAVREVTLFPHSAKIEETVKLPALKPSAASREVILILPPQADPESLMVSPASGGRIRIDDVRIKQIVRMDENRIAALRSQIKKLQQEKKEMLSRLQSLEVQLQFWQAQTKAKTKNVAEADSLAAAIGKSSRKIFSEKFAFEADLEKTDRQIRELQDSLSKAAGNNEKAWEAALTLSGPVSDALLLNYTYTLAGCGWKPLYRLEASPAAHNIAFSWDAEIWQSTGEDWRQVAIHLATLQPVRTIMPGEIPPWIIKPRRVAVHRSARKEAAQPPAAFSMAQAPEAADAHAPVETLFTTYAVWSPGKINLSAGSRQRIKIRDEIWPAEFLFLARPSLSPQAFLEAQVRLSRAAEIPPGQAVFVIDGAVIGKRLFSLAGSQSDIYFGNSPFITVKSTTAADQSGVARFFQSNQTRQWRWLIEAENAGRAPVKLRIEEPVPQTRDERIKLTFKHNPEPSRQDTDRFVWMIDLAAGQKKTLETGVDLEAPGDMDIDFGRRR